MRYRVLALLSLVAADSVEGLKNLTQALMQETVARIQSDLNGNCSCGF